MSNQYLITGATSDVGIALLERLLAHNPGSKAVAQGWGDMSGLAPLQQQYPGQITLLEADLTSPQAVSAFVQEVETHVECPTHIIHLPALRALNTKFKKFDEDRLWLDMQVQIGSAVALCKTFLPKMAKQKKGRVLFMLTSYVIGIPPKNMAAYVTAKEALYGLAKSLSADYAAFGVTVNCVSPSMMETKFLAETPDLIVQAAAEAHPLKRNATPADVVPAMEFLLGEEAAFITGINLPITGGSAS